MEQQIYEWWSGNFGDVELSSVTPMIAGLSGSVLFKLNEDKVLKIFKPENTAFHNEKFALDKMSESGLSPQLIHFSESDEILGGHGILMDRIEGTNLMNLYYGYTDEQKKAALKQMTELVKKLHRSITIPRQTDPQSARQNLEYWFTLVMQRENMPGKIQKRIQAELKAELPAIKTGVGVMAHRDLTFGNVMVDGDRMWLIDFEQARIDFAWKELRQIIRFAMTSLELGLWDEREMLEFLLFWRKEIPEIFDRKFKFEIRVMFLSAIAQTYAEHDAPSDFIRCLETIERQFDYLFEKELLEELLV